MLAGIEVGGTKIVCAIGPEPGNVRRRQSIPTGQPDAAIASVLGFLSDTALRAVGIASFGPLDLQLDSPTYGAVTRTPKPGWSGVSLRAALVHALDCPVAIDTDVNAAGLAEAALGAGMGLDSVAYLTVGTGLGGGLIVNGRPLHGLGHPEMGHIRPRRGAGDMFAGVCPFHGDCMEGLASGAAIVARTGRTLAELGETDPVWRLTADYLGQLCASVVLIGAPQRIVIGGGVMQSNPGLFTAVRAAARGWLGGYGQASGALEEFIVPPALGADAGVTGAMLLAAALT